MSTSPTSDEVSWVILDMANYRMSEYAQAVVRELLDERDRLRAEIAMKDAKLKRKDKQ